MHATIERLSHDGRGVARIDGKTTFITGALPGEVVSFRTTRTHKRFDEALCEEVLQPSPARSTPPCPHFLTCGGCTLQHMVLEEQIKLKEAILLEQLQHVGGITPLTVLPPLSTDIALGYRRKARLTVRYVKKKQKVLVGFRELDNPRFVASITQCIVLAPEIGKNIEPLRQLIENLEVAPYIPQLEIAVGEGQVAIVFRNKVPLPDQDLQKLRDFGALHKFDIYLQPGGIDKIEALEKEKPIRPLSYTLPTMGLRFDFYPTDFIQVHATGNEQLITHALTLLTIARDERVLDLFCGIGNFSLPIAQHAAQVVGIEGAAAMIQTARANALQNHIHSVDFYEADLTQSLEDYPWAAGSYDKIILDPPRSGALSLMTELPRLGASKILYISCNPATLARDAKELISTQHYILDTTGVVDLFPHTSHSEAYALFVRTD